MNNYIILEAPNPQDLTQKVNACLGKEWKVNGAPFVSNNGRFIMFYQSLVKGV